MTRRPGQHAGWLERVSESLGLIETLVPGGEPLAPLAPAGDLLRFPPEEQWDDWVEYDAQAWPRREARHRMLVPTTCFNCEAACGLLAYVDKDTLEIQRFEGNPQHPASRGRTCAKGPATINQVHDTDRILYPLRRKGARSRYTVRIEENPGIPDAASVLIGPADTAFTRMLRGPRSAAR